MRPAEFAHYGSFKATETEFAAATRQTVFFGERGAYDFEGYGVVDLAASYNLAVWRTLRPWFKVEVYNLLNNTKRIAWDRTVTANAASTLPPVGTGPTAMLAARAASAEYVSARLAAWIAVPASTRPVTRTPAMRTMKQKRTATDPRSSGRSGA